MPELIRPTPAELDSMSHAEKEALILLLFDMLARYQPRRSEVERKVENTSQHSSKPPSAEGLTKGPARPRQPGEKPLGGQPGHSGATREMVDTPAEMRPRRPHGRCPCGACLDHLPARLGERRQPIEIPEPKVVVTAFRQRWLECPSCGLKHGGAFPAGVRPNVSFGPPLKVYAVGLVQGHVVALERTCEILEDHYGLEPCDGAGQNWVVKAGPLLAADAAATQQSILKAEVAPFAESGLRLDGKLNWLHVAATETAVYYTFHPKRGQEAREAAGLLSNFQGHAVNDHWQPYWAYTPCSHSRCNAHHLPELRYCEELTGPFWPIALRRLLGEGQEAVETARAAGKTGLEPAQVDALLACYDEHVNNGLKACPVPPPEPGRKGRLKQHEATNRLLRLRDDKSQVWRVLTDWRVRFDNHRAERAGRPVKLKLKVSGGCRAMGGAEALCILRSIGETNKLNSITPVETRRLAFGGR